jgi:uridine kinase
MAAIVGGSGAGKSWLARALCTSLGRKAGLISLDDFYRDRSHLTPRQREKINFDHPRSIDWPMLGDVLTQLAASQPAHAPGYDFKTHCRLPSPRLILPCPILIVEGLWLLRPHNLRRFFDLRVYVDCGSQLRLQRRLARDLSSRARTRASIRAQFRNQVEPMHKKFVEPQKRHADFVLGSDCDESAVSLLATRLKTELRRRASG